MFVRGTRYVLARLIVETRLDPEQRVMFCRGTRPFCGLWLCHRPPPPLQGAGTMPCIHLGGLHGWHGRSGHVAANATQSGVDQGHPWESGGIRARGEGVGWVGTFCLSRLEPAYPSALCGRGAAQQSNTWRGQNPSSWLGTGVNMWGCPLGRRPPLQQVGSTELATEGPGMLLGGEGSSSLAPCR